MSRRALLATSAALAGLTGACVLLFDTPVARLAAHSPAGWEQACRRMTAALEWGALFPVSKFALSVLLMGVGGVLWKYRRRTAVAFLYVGAAAFTARMAAGLLKNVFGRARPFEAAPDYHGAFFVDGSAFPSGHAAHFWGLYFPLAYLFPRYRWPLLVLPVAVSVMRVSVNDHFLGDVVAAAAVSAAAAWLLAWRVPAPEQGLRLGA